MYRILFFLFFLIFFVFSRTEEVQDKYSTIDITVVLTVLYVLLLSVYIGFEIIIKKKYKLISLYDKAFLIYILFSFVSCLWSENIFYTIFFSLYNFLFFLMLVFSLKERENPEQFVFNILNALMIFEVVTLFLRPTLDVPSSTISAFHGSGSIQAILAFVFFKLIKKKSKLNTLLALIDIIIFFISTSLKIYLATFIGLFIVYLIYNRKVYAIYFKLMLLILSIISLIILITFINFKAYDFGKVEHMGGRLLPWTIMLMKIKESFFLGYGFPFGDEIYIDKSFTIKNAHNVFLGSFLYLGVGGFLILSRYFLKTWRGIAHNIYSNYFYFIIIVCLVNSFFNNSIAGKITSSWVAVQIVFVYINHKKISNEIA